MRALVVAITVMGVLIVGGTVALVVLIVQRSVPSSVAAVSAVLDEPEGTRIGDVSLLPDRVAVRLHGGGPDRVVVLDARSGQVIGRVGLAR